MDISMDIHRKPVDMDMDMDGKFHIHGKPDKLQPKHKTTDELKVTLQTICEELPWEHVNKAVAIFAKCLSAYMAVAANGGHSKHLQ